MANAWRISFLEDLVPVSVMEMLAQSHVEVNVKFVGRVGPDEGADGRGEPAAEMFFLVGGASGWLLLAAVATVTGGDGIRRRWKKDGIVLVPVVGFSFLFETKVNGIS